MSGFRGTEIPGCLLESTKKTKVGEIMSKWDTGYQEGVTIQDEEDQRLDGGPVQDADMRCSVENWYNTILRRREEENLKQEDDPEEENYETDHASLVMEEMKTGAVGEPYDILKGLGEMKLNICLGQLLALVPEYSAKLCGWKEVPAHADRVAGICQAEPCADWDGVIPDIVVMLQEQELRGMVLDGGLGVNIISEATRQALGIPLTDKASFT